MNSILCNHLYINDTKCHREAIAFWIFRQRIHASCLEHYPSFDNPYWRIPPPGGIWALTREEYLVAKVLYE